MNNYAYLIKAKAKATDSRSLFCWFTAKSDSRAERKILDLLEDADIEVGRGADHQLPIRTNWHVVDDLPEEGVLDDTWCERYELGGDDGITWGKITAPEPEEKAEVLEAASSADDTDDAADENAVYPLATMPFRTQLLAQFVADDRHTYHISIPERNRLSILEMDVDNHAVQDLILAAENVPDIKSYDMPGLWKFTSAMKSVFPAEKRHELGKQVQFAKLWFQTSHLDRGILTKEWSSGNFITTVNRTPSGANAGGGNKTDRLTELTVLGLEYEIALGLIARDKEFDIYNVPMEIDIKANSIMNKFDNKEFLATRELFMSIPGGRDYSRACNIATVKTTPVGLWEDRVAHREHINHVMTETDHAHPDELIVDIACGRSSMPMPTLLRKEDVTHELTSKLLAAERGEFVEGISDPNDPKWLREDLTKTQQAKISNPGKGEFAADMGTAEKPKKKTYEELREDLDEARKNIPSKNIPVPETTSHVQMEETGGNEAADHYEMSEGKAAAEHAACDAEPGGASAAVNIESGHHNGDEELPADFVHIMVDMETMGKKSNAPIVSIGAVLFDPATGILGETFYKVVSLESSVSWGAEIDPSTVIWWLKQSPEARSAIANDDAIKLDDALLMFTDFVLDNVTGGRKKAQVWGNGATFDNTILRSSFDLACLDCPWDYWNDRDVRTMVELGRTIGFDPKTAIPFEGDRHNALADAQHQARYVSAIWQRLIKN
ncbi:3'-5' exoribonuclease [Raoultella ornithinolytica]|uniref:exonuclease n=1 Tax=Raoultella ornithinolytica TaxID=54291 RepID=UPI0019506611|nr:exonuclease [Raoultella ornithinolytica]MBM6478208.1 3'-5' exoribonuclease [Raoultella ornithinolytica]